MEFEKTNIDPIDEAANASEHATEPKIKDKWDVRNYAKSSWIVRNVPLFMCLAFIALVHISNNHYAEKTLRQTKELEKEVKKLKWQYISTDAQLNTKLKQSSIADLVANQKLEELVNPPHKIEVEK